MDSMRQSSPLDTKQTELVSGVWLTPVILVLIQSKYSQSQGNSGHDGTCL